jgi:hypothetical protein
MEINHQWSKSLEFEKMLQQYVYKYISEDLNIFSMLRPFSELSISQIFCQHPEYFSTATSCNKNWKIDKKKNLDGDSMNPSEANSKSGAAMNPSEARSTWCGQCPKCAFVFCQMAAFLPSEKLINIFGKNLFEDETLIPLYRQLLDLEGIKPFECVGTPEETSVAFLLALNQNGWEETKVMQMFLTEKAPAITNPKALIEDVLSFSENHVIPQSFLSTLKI